MPPSLAAVARHLLALLRALQQQLRRRVALQLLVADPLKQRVRLQAVALQQQRGAVSRERVAIVLSLALSSQALRPAQSRAPKNPTQNPPTAHLPVA